MRNPLTHLTIHVTMPTLTPASMLVLLPSTQPRPSVRVLASTDTRSCASSAGVLCNEVVGVPRHRLPRTNASSGQRKHGRPNARLKRGVEKWGCSIDQTQGRRRSKDPTQGQPCPTRGRSNHNPQYRRLNGGPYCRMQGRDQGIRPTRKSLCLFHLPRMHQRVGGGSSRH